MCNSIEPGSEVLTESLVGDLGNTRAFSEHVDFDIHGLLGVRLVNPSPSDVSVVAKQLGLPRAASLGREPDISIRFEKKIPLSKLTYLGAKDVGFTQDSFFLLTSKKANAKVRIPFENIGGECEIVCESGLRAVPLLIPILNLTLLRKDCIPIHASAFIYNGVGILTTGWSKGGKTEALLAFASEGASYVGDEWVILTKDGQTMFGLPEPIRVWDWHIEQLPLVQPHVKSSRSLVFKVIHMLERTHSYLQRGRLKTLFPLRIIGEAMPALKRQLYVDIAPQRLFANETLRASFQKLFFVCSHDHPRIAIEPWDCTDIARRMLHSLRYEQMPFFAYYEAFRFAFPGVTNEFLENTQDIQSQLLLSALQNKTAHRVGHPYPVCLKSLFTEMAPFCTPG